MIKFTIKDDTKCWKKGNSGQCCCNCDKQHAVNGHPWVTKTSIATPTGMFVCTALGVFIISHKHGACEEWVRKKYKGN